MKPNSIPIPDHFTLEGYKQQKEQQISDIEIAESLYICYKTLQKWKKQIGWTVGDGRKYLGRKRIPVTDKIVQLHNKGLNNQQIGEILGVAKPTVAKHLWEYSGKRKPKTETKITREIALLAESNGIGFKTLSARVYNQRWSVEKAATYPVDVKKRKKSKVQ